MIALQTCQYRPKWEKPDLIMEWERTEGVKIC